LFHFILNGSKDTVYGKKWNFLGHSLCTGTETEDKWLYLICIFIRVVRKCIQLHLIECKVDNIYSKFHSALSRTDRRMYRTCLPLNMGRNRWCEGGHCPPHFWDPGVFLVINLCFCSRQSFSGLLTLFSTIDWISTRLTLVTDVWYLVSLHMPFCPELDKNVNSGKKAEWIEMTTNFSVFNADNHLFVWTPHIWKSGVQFFFARFACDFLTLTL